jgi:hypothetical protein
LLSERLAHVFGLVVNRSVKAEFGDEIAALLGAAGDPDAAAAMEPGYLSPGSGAGSSVRLQSLRLGSPTGLAASRN